MSEPALPRLRALLTVVFAGAAVLSLGGLLEYGTGSPDAGKTVASGYWAAFFAFHTVAFGGAALLGGVPAIAVRPVKVLWLVALVVFYGIAFFTWARHQDSPLLSCLGAWAAKAPLFVPAATAVAVGLLWSDLPGGADESSVPSQQSS